MFVNGIVIQKYVDNPYKGIDGSGFSEKTGQNWFFNQTRKSPASLGGGCLFELQ